MKNVVERCLKTFVEAALGYLVTMLSAGVDFQGRTIDKVLLSLLGSAVAVGVSAIWNGVIDPMLKEDNKPKIEDGEE